MEPRNEIVVFGPSGTVVASWTLPPVSAAELSMLDELAHLALAARRLGYTIRLRNACAGLVDLVDLAGLGEVLGETEGGEEIGIEEVVVPDDPVA